MHPRRCGETMTVREGGPPARLPSIIAHVQIHHTAAPRRIGALDGLHAALRADLLDTVRAPQSVFVLPDADAFLNFECIDATHVAVMRFRSDHDFANPGSARIRISQVSCEGAAGPDTLSAVVVSATGDPCDPAAITAMGPCISGTDDLVWESSTLDHNSEYFLLIGTQHDPADTLCAMVVELEGDGVTMDACCNHTLIPGSSAELTVVGGDPVFGYVWSPDFYLSDPDAATTTVTPAETITYQVDGQIGDCQVSSSVTVTVGSPISVPNSFTPNGDNVNDFWGIDGIAAFPGAKVEIFNRWGQLVHRLARLRSALGRKGRSGKPLTPARTTTSSNSTTRTSPSAGNRPRGDHPMKIHRFSFRLAAVVGLLTAFLGTTDAQQLPLRTNWQFNYFQENPLCRLLGLPRAQGGYRQQWAGFDGAPKRPSPTCRARSPALPEATSTGSGAASRMTPRDRTGSRSWTSPTPTT